MIQPSWNVTSLVAARAVRATDTTPPPAAMAASSAAERPSTWRRVRSWLVGIPLICPPRGSARPAPVEARLDRSATLAGFPGESKRARLRCHGEFERGIRGAASRLRDARRKPDLGPRRSFPRARGDARSHEARPAPPAHAVRPGAPGGALPRAGRARVPAHPALRPGGRRGPPAPGQRMENVRGPWESGVVLNRWLAGNGFESLATCRMLEASGRQIGMPVITGDCVSPVLARVCGMHLAYYHVVANWGTGLEPDDPTITLNRLYMETLPAVAATLELAFLDRVNEPTGCRCRELLRVRPPE